MPTCRNGHQQYMNDDGSYPAKCARCAEGDGTCPTCKRVVGRGPNGRLYVHTRYVAGGTDAAEVCPGGG